MFQSGMEVFGLMGNLGNSFLQHKENIEILAKNSLVHMLFPIAKVQGAVCFFSTCFFLCQLDKACIAYINCCALGTGCEHNQCKQLSP